jgi:hypothetical protein
MKKIWIALAGAGLLSAACTTTGNVERNAFGGAAIGSIVGAVIGNNVGAGDAGTGAAIGAALGGSVGAVRGCQQDGACNAPAAARRQFYDQRVGRYYYYDQRTGRYYWEDGTPR